MVQTPGVALGSRNVLGLPHFLLGVVLEPSNVVDVPPKSEGAIQTANVTEATYEANDETAKKRAKRGCVAFAMQAVV